jgi:hypothetical protein
MMFCPFRSPIDSSFAHGFLVQIAFGFLLRRFVRRTLWSNFTDLGQDRLLQRLPRRGTRNTSYSVAMYACLENAQHAVVLLFQSSSFLQKFRGSRIHVAMESIISAAPHRRPQVIARRQAPAQHYSSVSLFPFHQKPLITF